MAADRHRHLLPSAFLVAISFFVLFFSSSIHPGTVVEGLAVMVGPGDSISSALSDAQSGDEVQVAAGNYSEPAVVITKPYVSLRLLGEVAVTLQGGDAEWLTIQGVSFSMHQGRLNLTGGIGLDGGEMLQDNDVVITLPDVNLAAGVDIRNGTWSQSGSLEVNAFPSNFDFTLNGVRVASVGKWKQGGAFVGAQAGPFVTAVLLDGVWQQDGPVTISADQGRVVWMNSNSQWIGTGSVDLTHSGELSSGVYIAESAVWKQSVGTFTAHGTNTHSCDPACYTVGCWGEWQQGGNAVINISDDLNGVYMGPFGKWKQDGNIALTVASTSYITVGVNGVGESSPSPDKRWNQNGPVSLNVTGSLSSGIICGSGFSWFSASAPVVTTASNATGIGPNCALLVLPSPSPVFIISNATNVQFVPTLLINLTTDAVTLLPQDPSGEQQSSAAVSLSLGTISSRSTNNSTRTATVANAKWATAPNNTLGAAQSFIYSCELQFDSDSDKKVRAGGAMLGLQYYLFTNTTEVNLGGDTPVKFNVSPAFAKFTVRLTDWVWQSPDDPDERAEVRVAITPAFTGFFEVAGDETDFVREFALTGQQTTYSGQASTRVRLVEAVELDGKLVTAKEAGSNGRKAVEFTLEASSSSLVLSFARFNTTAVYDPDLGVLLTGRNGDGGGSSDNTGLIIGVAVAVPVAVLLVLAVIVSAVVITYWRKKQQVNVAVEAAINFNPDDGL